MPMAPQIENIKFKTLLKGIIDAKAEAKIVIPITTIRVLFLSPPYLSPIRNSLPEIVENIAMTIITEYATERAGKKC